MYRKVFSYWKDEETKKDLVKLPRDFYEKALLYLEDTKKTILEDTEDLLTSIILAESTIVRALLNDLFKIRIKKIILLQRTGKNIPIEELTNLELKFLTSSIQKFGLFINNLEILYKEDFTKEKVIDQNKEERILESTSEKSGNKEREDHKEHLHMLIKINKDLPEITGADLKTYGPFKKGDIVHIPKINAKILLEKRVAEKIELNKKD